MQVPDLSDSESDYEDDERGDEPYEQELHRPGPKHISEAEDTDDQEPELVDPEPASPTSPMDGRDYTEDFTQHSQDMDVLSRRGSTNTDAIDIEPATSPEPTSPSGPPSPSLPATPVHRQ